ncbi:recombinase family protein [Bacillus inaquosorum]|uniref:Recombinase family protein n=1 Tax=Bacillus vallismortis TaxID=72361 RepID=A0ABY4Y097_BACVA|nr:recombinase family protein [Bacillus vallismortis]USP96016.1 recombinase family protein [Bacillus vallismortis]
MIFGYARPFSQDQDVTKQITALKGFNCEKIYIEQTNSAKNRPEFESLCNSLNTGDTVIIYKLYSIADSTKNLIDIIDFFKRKQIHFISILDKVDTTKKNGSIFFDFLERVGKFQFDMISENTKLGIQEAKLKGKNTGRPRKPDHNVRRAMEMYQSKTYTIQQITKETGISKTTLYRYLDNWNDFDS